MSDFGANIFDEPEPQPAAKPERKPRKPRKPRARKPEVEVAEVPVLPIHQQPLAILLDLDDLAARARATGSELALTRLHRALADGRQVAAALSFQSGKRAPAGFHLPAADPTAPGSLHAAAHAYGAQGCGIVLAPPSPQHQSLAHELRATGVAVELWGLQAAGSAAAGNSADNSEGQCTLPRSCLFVP